MAPFDAPALFRERLSTPFELLLQLWAERELRREAVELRIDRPQHLGRDRRLRLARGLMREGVGAAVERWLGRLLADRCLALRQALRQRLGLRGRLVGGDDAIGLQALQVEPSDGRMRGDG